MLNTDPVNSGQSYDSLVRKSRENMKKSLTVGKTNWAVPFFREMPFCTGE